jgi:DNA-binding transcriptional ArsR family regulator
LRFKEGGESVEKMLYRVVAEPEARNIVSEAEGVSYARIPERIIDVDSERIDFFATLLDPRNWRGTKGQKQQAALLWLVRQWNAQPLSTGKTLHARGIISINAIRKGTGMDPDTIDSALTALGEKGIIRVLVDRPNTRETRFAINLRLPVSRWNLPHIHRWQEARQAGIPF